MPPPPPCPNCDILIPLGDDQYALVVAYASMADVVIVCLLVGVCLLLAAQLGYAVFMDAFSRRYEL
ncbi:MAG: hypothetical protein NZM11_00695 [Anaerolineales bacterium]|nr:hypothetical protein [Anaerolineales bacterium]